jgi:DNA-binding transcriptional regulator GbsR (MarR family)
MGWRSDAFYAILDNKNGVKMVTPTKPIGYLTLEEQAKEAQEQQEKTEANEKLDQIIAKLDHQTAEIAEIKKNQNDLMGNQPEPEEPPA